MDYYRRALSRLPRTVAWALVGAALTFVLNVAVDTGLERTDAIFARAHGTTQEVAR